MKNVKTRLIAFTFLALASISAYSYLNTVPQPEESTIYGVTPESTEEQDVYLPDVEMVNKIIEAGKKLRAFNL